MTATQPRLTRTRISIAPAVAPLAWLLLCLVAPAALAASSLRPPSVPLVACDPYFSIWSPADKLTDADTVHWTGKRHRLTSWININGKNYRLMGHEQPDLPAMPQMSVAVLPTRTIYTFWTDAIRLTLTFM